MLGSAGTPDQEEVAMKVPDELVEAAVKSAGLPENQGPRMRVALEAVLPKVRERVISDEATEAAAKFVYEGEGQGGPPFWEDCPNPGAHRGEAAGTCAAAFDHAFPEEGS
jgi:hypothetical protein